MTCVAGAFLLCQTGMATSRLCFFVSSCCGRTADVHTRGMQQHIPVSRMPFLKMIHLQHIVDAYR